MARLTVPLYAITLILSAFLLFSVQPMFAKMLLPLLGGTPSVWNIAMVFFQTALLAGYAYAHGTSRLLGLRAQALLHLALLVVCATFLPFALPNGLRPAGNPALWQIGIMAGIVGAPFFIVSASAPMIQRWFTASGHKDAFNPYFLYAASNIGSMAALLSYPVLVEPHMTIDDQSIAWTGGYQILIVLFAACALSVWNGKLKTAPRIAGTGTGKWMIAAWLGLAFIPSSLMLGVTTYITTDLAAIPLLWILPLSLYLLTFILVFARREIVSLRFAVSGFSIFLVLTVFVEAARALDKSIVLIFLHLALFFFAALLCNKKLADLRPAASDLTGYYMIMSLGGVLGGMFNALLAPVIFVVPVEYSLVLCATLFIRGFCFRPDRMFFARPDIGKYLRSPSAWFTVAVVVLVPVCWALRDPYLTLFMAALVVTTMMMLWDRPMAFALLGSFLLLSHSDITTMRDARVLDLRRNFFGVLQVNDAFGERNFMHGTTLHGAQPLDPRYRLTQMTYYNPHGPLGDVFRILDKRKGPQRIAAIGLGVGTVACYRHPGRSFDFYEIDPDVAEIAQDKDLFTYLSGCKSPYTITLGDGRLMLDRVPDATYDVLILDAFSSDNIPMHLITLDAFKMYMKKVKAGGMIVVNISNHFLNLEPQIAALSRATHVPAALLFGHGQKIAKDTDLAYTSSLWVVFTPDAKALITLRTKDRWRAADQSNPHPVWTDAYANILSALILPHLPAAARHKTPAVTRQK